MKSKKGSIFSSKIVKIILGLIVIGFVLGGGLGYVKELNEFIINKIVKKAFVMVGILDCNQDETVEEIVSTLQSRRGRTAIGFLDKLTKCLEEEDLEFKRTSKQRIVDAFKVYTTEKIKRELEAKRKSEDYDSIDEAKEYIEVFTHLATLLGNNQLLLDDRGNPQQVVITRLHSSYKVLIEEADTDFTNKVTDPELKEIVQLMDKIEASDGARNQQLFKDVSVLAQKATKANNDKPSAMKVQGLILKYYSLKLPGQKPYDGRLKRVQLFLKSNEEIVDERYYKEFFDEFRHLIKLADTGVLFWDLELGLFFQRLSEKDPETGEIKHPGSIDYKNYLVKMDGIKANYDRNYGYGFFVIKPKDSGLVDADKYDRVGLYDAKFSFQGGYYDDSGNFITPDIEKYSLTKIKDLIHADFQLGLKAFEGVTFLSKLSEKFGKPTGKRQDTKKAYVLACLDYPTTYKDGIVIPFYLLVRKKDKIDKASVDCAILLGKKEPDFLDPPFSLVCNEMGGSCIELGKEGEKGCSNKEQVSFCGDSNNPNRVCCMTS